MKLLVGTADGRQYVYTTEQADGAPIANGKRVRKTVFEEGDAHPIGAMATVVGSIGPDEKGVYGYFVRWDDRPDVVVAVVDYRVAEVT